MEIFDAPEETFEYIAGELGKLNLAYIHVVDHSSMGAPKVTDSVKAAIKNAFDETFIACGGMSKEKAESILNNDEANLIAFGRDYLANPDLVEKFTPKESKMFLQIWNMHLLPYQYG